MPRSQRRGSPPPPLRNRGAGPAALVLLLATAPAACGDGPAAPLEASPGTLCSLPQELLATGAVPEAIPALTEPAFVLPEHAGYLDDSDRVLGVVVKGEARAYPHRILWSHEVVNDRFGREWVTVSFCPLTGSGLAMDAVVDGRRVEFGVSGLLFANNLVTYDRLSEDLFGPQMSVEGRCQGFRGVAPELVAVREMSWGRWRELHPHTSVLSDETGHSRNYQRYPYGSYDEVGNDDLLYPMEPDRSRPIKERVLGVRTGDRGGRGYPFGELAALGERGALNHTVDGEPVAVFWERAHGEAAAAYDPVVDGVRLTFEAVADGYRDQETGTLWDLSGRSWQGPLAPVARLRPLPHAYVAFWFAWKHFQPETEVWTAG